MLLLWWGVSYWCDDLVATSLVACGLLMLMLVVCWWAFCIDFVLVVTCCTVLELSGLFVFLLGFTFALFAFSQYFARFCWFLVVSAVGLLVVWLFG